MKPIILAAGTIIFFVNASEARAQLSLSCHTQGSLTLINKYTLNSTQPAQCSLRVDNSVKSINVNVTLSEPTLLQAATTGEKPDPPGTNRVGQLNYSNNGTKIINQNTHATDTFLGSSTTPILVNMQVQRPKVFYTGFYIYQIFIDVTPN